MKYCLDLQILLKMGKTKDIIEVELYKELVILSDTIVKGTQPLKDFKQILLYNAHHIYRHIFGYFSNK